MDIKQSTFQPKKKKQSNLTQHQPKPFASQLEDTYPETFDLPFAFTFLMVAFWTLMSACVHKERESHLGSVHGTMIATTHAMWEHSGNVPWKNNLFSLRGTWWDKSSPLFLKQGLPAASRQQPTVFLFCSLFFFRFKFLQSSWCVHICTCGPWCFLWALQHKYNRVKSIHYALSHIW